MNIADVLVQICEDVESLRDWDRYVSRNPMLKAGVEVLQMIEKQGFKAFIVGGCVRDIIIGVDPKDVDIATDANLAVLEKMFKTHDIGKSKDFGIVTVKHKGFDLEVANFRKDGKYSDGRRPETVEIVGSFEDDASRRDFTVNAMGLTSRGEILDYFNGRKDIKNKILRTVGDPIKRFKEDKLRILRTARFASRFGLDIDSKTKIAARRMAPELTDLSWERIRDELFKAAGMGGDKFSRYIEILDNLRILQIILPEIAALKYKPHSKNGHPEADNVFGHLVAALKNQPGIKDPMTNLAILLHDVGKVKTQGVKNMPWGQAHTYLGHAEEGVEIVNRIADRLKMSNKDREALIFATLNHMRVHDILKMKPSKVAKLVNDKNWDILLAVAKADRSCRPRGVETEQEMNQILDLVQKVKDTSGSKEMEKITKLVSGNRIMELTGVKPGPFVGQVKTLTLQWILDNGITDPEKIDDHIRELAKVG